MSSCKVFCVFFFRCLTCDSATDKCSSRRRPLRPPLPRKRRRWQEISPERAAWAASRPQSVSPVAPIETSTRSAIPLPGTKPHLWTIGRFFSPHSQVCLRRRASEWTTCGGSASCVSASSRAGGPTIPGRASSTRRAGWRSTFTALCSFWTRCCTRCR